MTPTRALLGLQARELLRDRRYFLFAMLFPFAMLGIFLLVGSAMPTEEGAPDFRQTTIPMAMFLAVTSTALTVTAGPLAALRERGTLRLLGTTPVGRGRFVLTHLAVRVGMVLVQLAALLAIATGIGALPVASVPAMFGAALLGLALFMSIGYLIGGRLRSADPATNLGTLVQLGSLFLSGLAIPFWLLPPAVAMVLSILPTSLFADLMVRQMPGAHPMHPPVFAIAAVVLTAAAVLTLAIRTFRWDQGEAG